MTTTIDRSIHCNKLLLLPVVPPWGLRHHCSWSGRLMIVSIIASFCVPSIRAFPVLSRANYNKNCYQHQHLRILHQRGRTPLIPASLRFLSSSSSDSSSSDIKTDSNEPRVMTSPPKATTTTMAGTAFPSSTWSIGSSNQDLVQHRLRVAKEKRDARKQSIRAIQERNFYLKRILHQDETGTTTSTDNQRNTSSTITLPALYALKVCVCHELREELKLSGREKRGRVFVEHNSTATTTLRGLRQELHAFFRALRKGTFLLSAGLPDVLDDGTIGGEALHGRYWSIESDDDVARTFQQAQNFFQDNIAGSSTGRLKRPSIVIQVTKDPNAPPPKPIPSYLADLPNPADSPTMTMLSFYSFPPEGIVDPEEFAQLLRKTWKPFQALGRIYVAREGVNAQMSVPTNVLDRFMESCRSIPELGTYMENGINIDPLPLSREEFATAGTAAGEPAPPFTNLHIRVRSKIVADGLDKELDWTSAGYDMPPLEWHDTLKQAKAIGQTPILLDCRNLYESEVGRFEGSEPVPTENFRDTWKYLADRLKDTPKDTPIFGYCTGGIRCVKVGAYLTQEMGYKNFTRLAGGIIAYDRVLKEKAPEEESLFKGTNFVFDGRLGRAITDDALGTCLTCGSKTSLVSNCRNENCHHRMIQCETCRTKYFGTCSEACRHRVLNGFMRPLDDNEATDIRWEVTSPPREFKSLDEYSSGHSSPIPSAYKEMEMNTKALIPSGSHMVSGSAQGRLLTQLASMTREGRILEMGTFTGYATACLLEGAYNVGQLLARTTAGNAQNGPYVLSMERDRTALGVAMAHLSVITKHGTLEGDGVAEDLCALRTPQRVLHEPSQTDEGSEMTTKNNKPDDKKYSFQFNNVVGCDLLHVTDALATMEHMALGGDQGSDSVGDVAPFDLVFLDADKTRLLAYMEACLSNDRILKKGGYIVVDNVLWKGLVLDASRGDFSSSSSLSGGGGDENDISDDGDDDDASSASGSRSSSSSVGGGGGVNESDRGTSLLELRKNRRARKLALTMHRFNSVIVQDPRVDVLVLPVRDGLSVIRKK